MNELGDFEKSNILISFKNTTSCSLSIFKEKATLILSVTVRLKTQ